MVAAPGCPRNVPATSINARLEPRAMSDANYPPLNETHSDDLPRTLRRERENRERIAREQQVATSGGSWDRHDGAAPAASYAPAVYGQGDATAYEAPYGTGVGTGAVTVNRFKVPFFSLMGFFIKCVFAAVPALLILMAMLYGIGVALQMYFPQLIKMKILISFP
jgi:hypothetical protein